MSGRSMRKLSISALIYAVGDLLTKGARFILIPFYVRYLSMDEVGALAILQLLTFSIPPIFSFGLPMSVARFYQDMTDKADRFVSSLWCIGFGLSLLGCSLLAVGIHFLPEAWTSQLSVQLLLLAVLAGFFRANCSILEKKFIIRREPMKYRSFTFAQFLSTTGLIIYLVVFRDLGLKGAVLGEVISCGCWMLVSVSMLFRAARPDFAVIAWRGIFRYAAPLAPHMIFMWAISYSDRLVLKAYEGFDQLAIYNSAYMLASLLPIFSLALKNAWLPDFFERAEQDRSGGKDFSAKFGWYLFICLIMALLIIVCAPPLVHIFLTKEYLEATRPMQVVAFGLIFHAIWIVFVNPLYYAKRTKTVAAISAFVMITNILANLLLIPRYSLLGAAGATVIAYAGGALICFMVAQKEYNMNLTAPSLGGLTLLFFLFAGCGVCWPPGQQPWIDLGLRGVAVLLFPVLVILIPGLLPGNRPNPFRTGPCR